MSLAPVSREDYPAFYEWRTDLESLPLWSLRSRRIVTFEEFVPELDRFLSDGGITMAALENKTGLPGGFARAYDFNWLDSWGWVGCYAAPDGRLRPRHFGEAVTLFLAYLFSHFPLRKLYGEIAAYNSASQGIAEKLGFTEEGRLTEHVWLGDRFWDARHYSLTREAWQETAQRLRRLPGMAEALDRITYGDHGAPPSEDGAS